MKNTQDYQMDLLVDWKSNNFVKLHINIEWKNKKCVLYIFFLIFLLMEIFYDKNTFSNGSIWIVLITMILSFIYIAEIDRIKNFFVQYTKWIGRLAFTVSPFISLIIVELLSGNSNYEMIKKYGLINSIWYYLLYFLIYIFFTDTKVTIIVSNLIFYFLAFVNYCVMLFRGSPILPSDIKSWETGLSVISNYKFILSNQAILATFIMLLWLIFATELENTKSLYSMKSRISTIVIYLIFSITILTAFFKTDLIDKIGVTLNFWVPSATYNKFGTVLGFMANAKELIVETPDGYSVDQVELAFDGISECRNVNEKPNIIVIMNEAYSDLSVINAFDTNIEYMPYTKALTEDTVKGNLFVSVHGGLTCNTEYEFLTGNSMAVMPLGSVPYQQYISNNTNSLCATLKEQGYYNVAIHPYLASGYNRDKVYSILGFDKFITSNDFENPELIRNYISDRESYKKIIDQFEKKDNETPLFIFNVTMQNHGGYTSDDLSLEMVKLTELSGYPQTERYLSLIRESEKAFQELVEYFSEQAEPTVILMFGDHQPAIEEEFYEKLYGKTLDDLSLEELQKRYIVPFIMWANYGIPKANIDKISANYLSSLLLQTANLERTEYNQYLLNQFKEIPVINSNGYIGYDNRYYSINQQSTFTNQLSVYKYIVYNNVFDRKNRLNGVYSID